MAHGITHDYHKKLNIYTLYRFKTIFSNIELYKMEPVIVDQPILSWNDDIIKRFINNDHKYECFMNKSLKNDQLLE
ncbi:hypothetical protein GLOIN_2v1473270 [Rhizophagus irregularis DAOM 181602=DAOM 197198]|nr:hypothetical protein GLOIN_2v1473270 [Rhizophagus irregularis DAOM 181602=DAOM 197198]